MKILLYDGDCGFCKSTLDFVWKRDPKALFNFASIQSRVGQKLLRDRGIKNPKLDTFYLIDDGDIYSKSRAAFRVCKELSGLGWLGRSLLYLPRGFGDFIYDIVARNRMLFSRDYCQIPPDNIRQRFLS